MYLQMTEFSYSSTAASDQTTEVSSAQETIALYYNECYFADVVLFMLWMPAGRYNMYVTLFCNLSLL